MGSTCDATDATPKERALHSFVCEENPMPIHRWRWWSIALRGVAALALGIISLFWPGLTFVSLVFVFAAYAIVDGVLALMLASKNLVQPRGWIIVRGLVSVAAGLIAFLIPGITAFALLVVIAAWAIVAGISEIVMAVKLRKMIKYEWLLGLEGGLSIAFGVLLLLSPLAGAIVIGLWIGAYALMLGGMLIADAFRLRRASAPPPVGAMPAAA
jgi:uncharacterized membrane protein HdeD (DUF308 family)